MKIFKNLKYNAEGGVDATYEHPDLGDVPYTLSRDEVLNLPANTTITDYVNPQTPAQILEQNKIELINQFESDLQANALDIASAIAEDGVNEDSNVDALRADRLAIKSKFQSDMIALITGGFN